MNQEKIISEINENGYCIIATESSPYLPSVAYTIGLQQKYNHPEIIIFGLDLHNMKGILQEVTDMIKTGIKLQLSTCYNDFFDNGNAEFLAVADENIHDYFIEIPAIQNGRKRTALQLVWTDRKNKFPWEEGFEMEFKWKQPLLDRNASFKFREEKDLEVLVAANAIDNQKPILNAIHEHQGKWQFLTGDIPEKMKLISLEELIKTDPTINELYDLEYGEAAERDEKGSEWFKYKIELPDEE